MSKALWKVVNINSLSLIHWAGHKGDQVGQAACATHEPMLAGPDPLVVLHVPCDGTTDNQFYNLPQHCQADRPVFPWILLLAFVADGQPTWLTRSANKGWRVDW